MAAVKTDELVDQVTEAVAAIEQRVQAIIEAPVKTTPSREKLRRRRAIEREMALLRGILKTAARQAVAEGFEAGNRGETPVRGSKTAQEALRKRVEGEMAELAEETRKGALSLLHRMKYAGAEEDETPEIRRRLRERGATHAGETLRLTRHKGKDGKVRNYQTGERARLLMYGATRTAHSDGVLAYCAAHGLDLVKWSRHAGGNDGECGPFQGRTFSISGKDERFPKLTVVPPEPHPHCRHKLIPVLNES